MNLIREPPSSMNSLPMRIVPQLRITKKKITRAGTSVASRRWNMPTKRSNGLKKLIGRP